jgi:DHA1 family inner membrane transport protein
MGTTLGNFAGGRLADWRLEPTLIGVFVLTAVILALMPFAVANVWMTELALFAWAAIVFAGCATLQINAVTVGRDAPNLISTLNVGAFNAGNALGACAGGAVIGHGFGLAAIPLVASGLAVLALGLALLPRLARSVRPSTRAL